MAIVIGIGFLFFAISIALIALGGEVSGDIGKSLLTGSVVACAILSLQLHLDDQRRNDEKREQFRSTINFANDLSGIEPRYSLSGMFLRGKTLDNADLEGQDLTGTDLKNASLRHANLNDAELSGANLAGADLTEGEISGATLRNADLRAAQLNVTLDLPPDPAAFQGVKVNARTCWPEDFLANVHFPPLAELRHALERGPTIKRGKTVAEAGSSRSWGRACVLADVNIWDDLGLYASEHELTEVRPRQMRQSVRRLAMTFGRSPSNIMNRFRHGRSMSTFGPSAPAIQRQVCAGTARISGQAGELTGQGFGFIVVQRPGQAPGDTMVIRQPDGVPGQRYTVLFRQRLQSGTRLGIVNEVPRGRHHRLVKFSLWRRVRAC